MSPVGNASAIFVLLFIAAVLALAPVLKWCDDWNANRKATARRLQELEQLSSQQGEAQS